MDINPFSYSKWVTGEYFCGREDIIEKIFESGINGQGNIWITGCRQVGKTSLLRQIKTEYLDDERKVKLSDEKNEIFNVAIIFCDVQDCKNEDQFYAALFESIEAEFDYDYVKAESDYKTFLNGVKRLYAEKYYVVFLIDEFDALIQNMKTDDTDNIESFLAKMNKLSNGIQGVKGTPNALSWVMSSNHELNELVSDVKKDKIGSGLIIENIEIGCFKKDEVNELLTKYLKDNIVKFSDQEIETCYKLTDGYPFFIKRLFYLLYNLKLEKVDEKKCLKQIKKEYPEIVKETINVWGGSKTPRNTLKKISNHLTESGKFFADNAITAAAKFIAEFIKNS